MNKTLEKYLKMTYTELLIECKKYNLYTYNKSKTELITLLKLYL